jgi:16S rRNA (cytosine967-C5)-methyltransferase
MKPQPPHFRGLRHNARSLALQALLDIRRHDAFIQELLDRRLGQTSLAAADRRLATQLAYGVQRRGGTLYTLLQPLVTRQPDQVEDWLWDALELGAYQLALLTHIPPHAAIHETVELAALFGRPDAKGFLNGVLRKLAPLVTDDRTTGPAADALPLEQGEYRRLTRPVLPDPAARPVEYLSAGFGLRRWLAERWMTRYGQEESYRLGFWFAGPAPLTVRVNPLRTERDALLAAWSQAGVAAEAGEHPQAVRLRESMPVRELPGYQEGWFTVQDESAMHVATALAPEPGSVVLDACAAPGGKTTHLAELMRDRGRIIACDVDEERLLKVKTQARRLGLRTIATRLVGFAGGEGVSGGPFDAALVDVPCSNTGVLGRRPEARWRIWPVDIQHLVWLQTRILWEVAGHVRPGGVLVYSTCSIEPEENRAVVQAVLRERWDLLLEAESESVPGRPADGAYWARLRRRGVVRAEGSGEEGPG